MIYFMYLHYRSWYVKCLGSLTSAFSIKKVCKLWWIHINNWSFLCIRVQGHISKICSSSWLPHVPVAVSPDEFFHLTAHLLISSFFFEIVSHSHSNFASSSELLSHVQHWRKWNYEVQVPMIWSVHRRNFWFRLRADILVSNLHDWFLRVSISQNILDSGVLISYNDAVHGCVHVWGRH